MHLTPRLHAAASHLDSNVPGRRSAGPSKAVYLLGADDFAEEDVPEDAFVVYQVRGCRARSRHWVLMPARRNVSGCRMGNCHLAQP